MDDHDDDIFSYIDFDPHTQSIVFNQPDVEEAQRVEEAVQSFNYNLWSFKPQGQQPSATVTSNSQYPGAGGDTVGLNEPAITARDAQVSSVDDVLQFIQSKQKPNTVRARNRDLNNLYRWLAQKNELRELFNIPPPELDNLLSQFLLSVRKVDGSEYEPGSLVSMVYSFDNFLESNRYQTSISKGKEFYLTRETLKAKKIDLFSQGKGRKPNASSPVSEEEELKMWETGALGTDNPDTLNFTMWFIITKAMGLRPREEHRQIQWADFGLKTDPVNGKEFLELIQERGTKGRDGSDLVHDPRSVTPRIWATGHPDRCPVMIFKIFSERRPDEAKHDNSPFYLTPKWGKSLQNSSIWYFPRPLGKNKISQLMTKASEKAKIQRKKPHGVRKSMMKTMSKAKVPRHQMCQISGHKSELSVASYDSMDIQQQEEISNILTKTMAPTKPTDAVPPPPPTETRTPLAPKSVPVDLTECRSVDKQRVSSTHDSQFGLFHGANFTNCTFNINPQKNRRRDVSTTTKCHVKRRRILPLFDSDSENEMPQSKQGKQHGQSESDSDFEPESGVQF